MRTSWTLEEDKILEESFKTKQIKEIAKTVLSHRSYFAIENRIRILKIKKRIYNTQNNDYFSTPNIENAYIVGFIAADGCITTNNRLVIHLADKDREQLQYIKNKLNYTGKVFIRDRTKQNNKLSKLNVKKGIVCSLEIQNCQKIIKHLNEIWNIHSNKTYNLTQPDRIKDLDIILSYIMGYIDGDGYILLSKNDKLDLKYNLTIGITAREEFAVWVKQIFDNITPNNIKSNFDERGVIGYYNISGGRAYILAKMFLSLDSYRMPRKWDKAKKYIELMENNPGKQMITQIKQMLTPEIISFVESRGGKFPDFFK